MKVTQFILEGFLFKASQLNRQHRVVGSIKIASFTNSTKAEYTDTMKQAFRGSRNSPNKAEWNVTSTKGTYTNPNKAVYPDSHTSANKADSSTHIFIQTLSLTNEQHNITYVD